MFVLLSIGSYAQQSYPYVQSITTNEKVLKGRIDKYPITIYVQYHKHSNYHAAVFSVKGWYYYDKVKTKIPLVGLSSYNKLVLYHFDDASKSNELLDFETMKANHMEDMKYYSNLEGYKEKFTINDEANSWSNNQKTLNVHFDRNDLKVVSNQEYLWLTADKAFDLHQFGIWDWNFKLTSHKDNRYLLEFEHPSRLNVMGMCGAGSEKGFLYLAFDDNNMLLQYEEFITESCNEGLSVETTTTINEFVTEYQVYNFRDESTYTLQVDMNEVTIKKH